MRAQTEKFSTVHSFLQPLGNQQWNSAVTWEVQLSPNYLQNSVKARIGHSSYSAEQLFSNQALATYQELLIKLAFKIPEKNIEYSVDFEHRLSLTENTNRLTLQLYRWVDLNIFLVRHFDETGYNIKAGLKTTDVNLEGGLDLAKQAFNDVTDGRAFFRWSDDDVVSAVFQVKKKRSEVVDYALTTTLTLPHSTMTASGNVLVSPQTLKIDMTCVNDAQSKLIANVLVENVDSGVKVEGLFRTDSVLYSASIITRNDDIQSIYIDLDLGTKYILNMVSTLQPLRMLGLEETLMKPFAGYEEVRKYFNRCFMEQSC